MSIECRELTKSYRRRRILDKLSFAMHAPGILAVLGPNGSGKTTLLRLLAGLERPDQGQILVAGKPFSRRDIRSAGVCYSSLPPVMLNRSVRENLAYPLRQVDHHLERLGLTELSSQHATRLSAGEKQKLSLGRALIGKPRILLLDEPTASIDTKTLEDLEKLLMHVVAEHACHIIMATHQAEQAVRLGADVLRLEKEVPQ